MGLINKPFTFSAGGTIIASQHNSNFDTVYNLVNGSLSTANLSATAGIVDTQLAQIVTANKVAFTALSAAVKDEDDMTSDSATHLPTQQSVKAYVDDQVKEFGAYETTDASQVGGSTTPLAFGTQYQANYDGFVEGFVADNAAGINVLCQRGTSSANVTIQKSECDGAGVDYSLFCMTVKKNEYWKITASATASESVMFFRKIS